MAAWSEPAASGHLRPRAGHIPAAGAGYLCFADAEGLRELLVRLHRSGPGSWRNDTEAEELMLFVANRYAGLARRFDREPADAAAAAFESMLNPSTRTAEDPWAVVTVAVRITLIAQHRAEGLLTSTNRARRAEYSVFHDAQRFSDRESELADYLPALHTHDPDPHDEQIETLPVVADAAAILVSLGWPADATSVMVGYICTRLADIGDRRAAYEALRRDKAIRARVDIGHDAWIRLLRICLGNPAGIGILRHGILARLLIGDTVTELADAPELRTLTVPSSISNVEVSGG